MKDDDIFQSEVERRLQPVRAQLEAARASLAAAMEVNEYLASWNERLRRTIEYPPMTPDRLTRLEQAVGKLALHIEIMATVLRHVESPGIGSAVKSRLTYYADEAAEIARQFTGEPDHDEG